MQATYLAQFNNPPQPERERESTLIISPTSLTLPAISCIYIATLHIYSHYHFEPHIFINLNLKYYNFQVWGLK